MAEPIEIVLATEVRVPVMDVLSGEIIDEILHVDGIQHSGSCPLCDSHQREAQHVLGSIRDLETGRLHIGPALGGRVYFGADSASQRVEGLYRDRHLTDFSIGAKRLEIQEDRDGTRHVVRSMLIEGSTVVRGADQFAKVLPMRRVYDEAWTFNPFRAWQDDTIRGDDMFTIRLEDRAFSLDADGQTCRGEILNHHEGDALLDALQESAQRQGDAYVLRSADVTPELREIVRALRNPETVRITSEDLGVHYARGYIAD